jgi:hypothetical protein
MGNDLLHGHEVEFVYVDNGETTVGNRRPCGKCHKPDRDDEHDACLGSLPGVVNACCGHGDPTQSYIVFTNGITVRGFIEVKRETLIIEDLQEERAGE